MGLTYDFESDKKYNYENTISMTIVLDKTCFSPAEFVKGLIVLNPKIGNTINNLQNPTATLTLEQEAFYTYNVEEMDPLNNYRKHYVTKEAKENIILLKLNLDLKNFQYANLKNTIRIPFTFQIPLNAYPSCFFGDKVYVKHFLSINFPTISAKKTSIIVIKNPPYFSVYNRLYQSPAVSYKEIKKSKLILFSQGSFTAALKLPKNSFSYNEIISYEIDMDLTRLSLNVKYIIISIRRDSRKNLQYDHTKPYKTKNNIIAKKEIMLNPMMRKIHISDNIIIEGDNNPLNLYQKLDLDNRKANQKFGGIKLYPTCVGGLLSVEYFITMQLVMDSLLSSTEEFIIPIDLYEPFVNGNNNINNQQNLSYSVPNVIYPNPNLSYQPQPKNPAPLYNSQAYPKPMSQVMPPPPQQINQNNMNNQNKNDDDSLPTMEEIMQKTPEEGEDDNPAPPSFLNLNNNDNYPEI